MAFKRPGVFVEETTAASVTSDGVGPSTAVILGEHHRGPVDPTRVSSWGAFRRHFGEFGGSSTEVPFAAFLFFQNGGTDLWVQRVEGTGGTASTTTIDGRDVGPTATLQVDALNNGVWGNDVYVEIGDIGDGTTGRFDLTVYYGGSTNANRVERWTDLSMVDTDNRFVEKIVNHPTLGSTYIEVTDLDAVVTAPDDTPVVIAPTALTGGTDGTVATSDVSDAIDLLDVISDPFTLNIPDEQEATVIGAAITYAEGRGDVVVVVDAAADDTVATVATYADALSSSYGTAYFPHLFFSDPASTEANAVRLLPPGGAVLGKYAENDATRGTHKSPAGLTVRIRGAAGLPQRFTPTDLDALNESNVNAIRNVPGSGIVIMGARTLSNSNSDRHLSVRRTLIEVKAAAKDLTEFAIFEPNDENLWANIEARVGQYLRGKWQEGALRGATAAQAFYVKCDAELNTDAVVQSGEVRVEIGVATQRPAEFVIIRVGQWQGGQNADEIA